MEHGLCRLLGHLWVLVRNDYGHLTLRCDRCHKRLRMTDTEFTKLEQRKKNEHK